MKKLLIKREVIIQEYQAPIPGVEARPEKWVKGEEVLFEAPSDLTDYTYYPAIEGVEAIAGVPGAKEWQVIDQTQGQESELNIWLSGNLHKYQKGDVAEWHDLESNYDYKLAECLEKRRQEYPQLGHFLNAFFDGGANAIEDLKQARLAIKAKYPKPEQGENPAPVVIELFPDLPSV